MKNRPSVKISDIGLMPKNTTEGLFFTVSVFRRKNFINGTDYFSCPCVRYRLSDPERRNDLRSVPSRLGRFPFP